MADSTRQQNALLEPLIGEWSLSMVMPGEDTPDELPDVGARVTFEWIGDRSFLLERWRIPIPEAPDGIAIIGWDDGRGTFLQHYFDERAVARVYEMSFAEGVWKLERTKGDFSPFDFSQRFSGTFSADGMQIDGAWEIADDHITWVKDFNLIYRRVG